MASGPPPGPAATFGERLRHHRETAGLSQEELAERAGLSAKGLAALERGKRRRPYPHTVRRLAAALGLSDAERAELIAAVPSRADPTAAAVAARSGPARYDLPGYLDPLIGREREAATVSRLLRQDDIRLLTLTGPGGVGKTRLALHIAGVRGDQFPDGVVFVALASLSDAGLVSGEIALRLGVPEGRGACPLRGVIATLRDKRLLLLLDNLEHLTEAAPDVAELVLACPGLKLLATSRTSLRVRGEREFAVPPLDLPDPAAETGPDDLARSPAVRLFVARARSVQPDFALTAENGPAVAEICRRLDGLPLAIELAAARIRLLPPAPLRGHLERRLPLLTGGPRDLPDRLQTMRDAIAWSYDLLTPDEEALFRRLGVFAGGCTLAAAEAVGGSGEDGGGRDDTLPSPTSDLRPPTSVLDLMAALVDHSLVQRDLRNPDEPRYYLLETTREYALERLEASGEAAATRRRAAAYFLALAEIAEPELTGPEQQAWFDRLETEHDNLRAALAWSTESGDAETILRLATALTLFWYVRGHAREGRGWLEGAAEQARSRALLAALRANALSGAGYLAAHVGDLAEAFTLCEAGLAIAQALGDKRETARALRRLAIVAGQRGEADRAATLFEAALGCYRELDDQHGIAHALANLGQEVFFRGELDRANELLREAVARMREIDEPRGLAVALGSLGLVTFNRGDLNQAAAMLEEAIAIDRRLGYRRGMAIELDWLAEVARRRGDLDRSRSLQAESLGLWRELGDPVDLAVWFDGFASLAALSGRPEPAARYLGVAAGLREAIGHSEPPEKAAPEGTFRAVRDALGEEAFVAAWDAGRALPLAGALAEAEAAAADPVDELAAAPSPESPAP